MPSSPRPWGPVLALLALAAPLPAAPRTYLVDPAGSSVRIHVGKSGVFGFAGHTHEVEAPALTGEVTADPADLGASSVELTFEAGALKVLPQGEPPGDVPKVEEAMRGPKALDAARFPRVIFKSQKVGGREAGGAYELEIVGDMTLHGVTKSLTLPVRVEVSGDTLTASGTAVLRHDWFGLQPISVAGVVKVKNELAITYRIAARAR